MKLDDLTPHVINIAEKSKETFNNMIDKLIAVCKEKQKASEDAVKPSPTSPITPTPPTTPTSPTPPTSPTTPEEKPKDNDPV